MENSVSAWVTKQELSSKKKSLKLSTKPCDLLHLLEVARKDADVEDPPVRNAEPAGFSGRNILKRWVHCYFMERFTQVEISFRTERFLNVPCQ